MKNEARWKPTKFVLRGDVLCASRTGTEVAPTSRLFVDLVAPHYQALIEEHASGRLLDLGAGTAPLYGIYRTLVESVTCLDWNQSPHRTDHVDVQADLNEPLPLPNASYDTVLMTDVLEHVYRPHLLMAEVARILAPEGKLLLSVPFMYWIHESPHDYARYTGFMLRRLCKDNGLDVLMLEAIGGSPEVLIDLVGKHLGWSPHLATLHDRLSRWALRMPGVATLSRYSGRWFPQAYALVARKGLPIGAAADDA